jgi:predicted O-methyltransferase YrrM
MELAQEYAVKYPEMLIYLEDLKQIILEHIPETEFEGNSFYHHQSIREYPELYNKQLNLFWCGKQAPSRICEIGFNAGHSAMLLLLASSATTFTIFDIGHHRYTQPCLNYIEHIFPQVAFEYIVGDSTLTMPTQMEGRHQTYDLVHVDGGHSEFCATSDMKHADILLKSGGIMVVDDTDAPQINGLVNLYLASGKYEVVDVLKTFGYPHRVIRKR